MQSNFTVQIGGAKVNPLRCINLSEETCVFFLFDLQETLFLQTLPLVSHHLSIGSTDFGLCSNSQLPAFNVSITTRYLLQVNV